MPLFWKQLDVVSPVYILASRIFWSFVFCTLILISKKQFFLIKTVFKNKKEALLLALSGIFISLNWGLYIFAVNDGKILETSIAYYLSPIFSILLGVVFFKEKLHFFQKIASIFAVIGVLYSIISYGQVPLLAILLCLSFGMYSLVKKCVLSNSDTTIVIETLFLLPAAIIFIFYSETNGTGALSILHGWEFILLPLTGILTSLPLLFFSAGVKKTPFTVIGLIMFTSPTISFLIGIFIYDESFKIHHIITFIFVWMAALFFIIGCQKKGLSNA